LKEESILESSPNNKSLIKRILEEIIVLNVGFLLFQIIFFFLSFLVFQFELGSHPSLGLFLLIFSLVDFVVFYLYHFVRGSKFKYLERERVLRFRKGWIFLIVLPILYFGLTVSTILFHDMIYFANPEDSTALIWQVLSVLTFFLVALTPTLISWRDYMWYCNKYEL